ncbi:bifunctional molybdopterin-guanine dinucleotide biosynthesis protein MobA/MobB [Desulfuromonas sp. DDH964]|uniref:bifunctional molybdenum cofactor guanylyltransferase MobA/molybdopterin-guanine dinucleotide biosynthesis adaptor protein MobB n=1 Tax=Desulfuromonas sp. DDH964 TaxID=1823759 RepID=UPI00078E59AF|nr:bifunctional molybdenum cofactor guanylyltransferase MobA/molybdopterin-guanine dinucleotide biosynthesis adaptor protein MobB [Desulfuromonas sp. DDH964]AMV71213.1 bifunctional molybdopterin-guanine dinucleotide biosynthesis protein MobA/MobB [Desulfuromonas sp. DDH964]
MQDSPKERYHDVTGVLLAGGKSRRMGRDKALLELQGEPLFERALALLQDYFPRVLIAGDRPDLARPEVPALADHYPGSALGGIHTGLRAAATEWIFVVPCDMPFPDQRIVEALLRLRPGADAVVPRTAHGYEPVFALYHKNCLALMEAQLNQGRFRINELYTQLRLNVLDGEQLPPGWQRSLTNLNTPEQYTRAQEERMTPPVVSIVAKSGTGKTTLLEKLITELKARGYRVGAIKHDAHSFSIDHEGKDSWRLTQAGADTMLITSPAQIAMVKQNPPGAEPSLAETIATYCSGLDIVLTEGFKRNAMPKIEVHRQACGEPLLCRGEAHDPQLFAVASDQPLELDVPVLDLNDARGLVDLIVARFLA